MEMEVEQAIFASAGQAVHVSYLILAQEATQDAPLRKALIRAMESIQLTKEQCNWLEELRGTPSASINFSGLDANEIRAQCAMVTHAVKSRLPNPEMWALQARFGQTDFEDICDQVDGDDQLPHRPRITKRRYAFSAERITAIKGLSDWLAPSFPKIKPLAIDCMTGKYYANHKKLEVSFRDLAEAFGGSHMLYARSFKEIASKLHHLEDVGLSRLLPIFRVDGLVP